MISAHVNRCSNVSCYIKKKELKKYFDLNHYKNIFKTMIYAYIWSYFDFDFFFFVTLVKSVKLLRGYLANAYSNILTTKDKLLHGDLDNFVTEK